MNEQKRDMNCYQIAFTGEEDQPTTRDMIIYRQGKPYLISVTTPQFLNNLRIYNQLIDSSTQLDEKFIVLEDLPSVDELCQRLSQIPFDELKPYLTEQTL